jgi:hypothetical protein
MPGADLGVCALWSGDIPVATWIAKVATGMSLLLMACRFAHVVQNRIVFRPAAERLAQ